MGCFAVDLFFAPVPLFNASMEVAAYRFLSHRGGDRGAREESPVDGALNEPALELLDSVGIEPFAMDKPVFVPIAPVTLLSHPEKRVREELRRKVVFMVNPDFPRSDLYLESIAQLGKIGFSFAFFGANNPGDCRPLLRLCQYWMVEQSKSIPIWIDRLPPDLRHLSLAATNIGTQKEFAELARSRVYGMFEGVFYRFAVTLGKSHVIPLKINLIRMLNIVQDPDFEFREVAAIIQRDTALTISLFKLVNSPYFKRVHEISSIGQAVAILGEIEIRKWATTAVALILGSDKPDEITRLSLMRAKFAENLAESMRLGMHGQSLFIMGLFSVLDIVLDVTMREALDMVKVSDIIRRALVDGEGEFAPVLKIVLLYEAAEWDELSRVMAEQNLAAEAVAEAYMGSALWYRDLIIDMRQPEDEENEQLTVDS